MPSTHLNTSSLTRAEHNHCRSRASSKATSAFGRNITVLASGGQIPWCALAKGDSPYTPISIANDIPLADNTSCTYRNFQSTRDSNRHRPIARAATPYCEDREHCDSYDISLPWHEHLLSLLWLHQPERWAPFDKLTPSKCAQLVGCITRYARSVLLDPQLVVLHLVGDAAEDVQAQTVGTVRQAHAKQVCPACDARNSLPCRRTARSSLPWNRTARNSLPWAAAFEMSRLPPSANPFIDG